MLRMSGNKLTWLGHATVLLTTPSGAAVLLIRGLRDLRLAIHALKPGESLE